MGKNRSSHDMRFLLALSAGAALLLFGWLFTTPPTSGTLAALPATASVFLLASIAGFAVRSLARKAFFGSKITLHQSFSFECLSETARLLDPSVGGNATELEFTRRETSLQSEPAEWIDSKLLVAILIGTLVLSAGIFTGNMGMPTPIMIVLTMLLLSCFFLLSRRALPLCAVQLAAMALEGGIFAFGMRGTLSVHESYIIYSFFTILLGISPFPFAIGFAEICILPFLFVPGILQLMLLFHVARILPPLLVAPVYFARYKFAFKDFFRPGLAEAIHASRRPLGGWSAVQTSGKISASIVIPAYNEEKRLPGFLKSVQEYMDSRKGGFEVIIVDDGSKDATAAVVEQAAMKDPRIRLARQIPNQGKGAAVRRGILEARGGVILFADADGATPISELDKFLPLAEEGHEILIGSRKAGSQDVERSRNSARALMGFVFYKIVNFFAVPAVRDTQCGFKMFRHDVAERLFSRSSEKGWAFDVEILYLAQLYGYEIVEVPVNWHEVEGSKVNPVKDSFKMLMAIFRIRRRHSGFTNEHQ